MPRSRSRISFTVCKHPYQHCHRHYRQEIADSFRCFAVATKWKLILKIYSHVWQRNKNKTIAETSDVLLLLLSVNQLSAVSRNHSKLGASCFNVTQDSAAWRFPLHQRTERLVYTRSLRSLDVEKRERGSTRWRWACSPSLAPSSCCRRALSVLLTALCCAHISLAQARIHASTAPRSLADTSRSCCERLRFSWVYFTHDSGTVTLQHRPPTSLRRASSVGSQHDASRIWCWAQAPAAWPR